MSTLTAFLQALLLGQELTIYTIIFILVGKFLPVIFSLLFKRVSVFRLLQASEKIRLLDVGSCFNPFLKFEEFLTVGIDIVPAVEVCDF